MNVNDLYKERDQFYLRNSGGFMVASLVAIVLGLGILGYGFTAFEGKRVWGAYLFNLFFFFCLGLGGMAMSAIQDVIGAIWARPIRRIWEAFGCFVPVSTVLFGVFILAVSQDWQGAQGVYSWIANPEEVTHFYGKNMWLIEFPFYCRVMGILTVMSLATIWQLRFSVRRDQLFVNGQREEAERFGEEYREKSNFWSGLILVIYGVGLTFLGMDLAMSLSPLWFSTLWGGWQFAIMMQTLFATSLMFMFGLKKTKVGEVIARQQFHDVGKLMHGFTVFFAYLTFAHVLTYWYGNVPEETEFFIERLHRPWLDMLIVIPFIAFVIPLYSLIFQSAKWTAVITIPLCLLILVGQWMTNLLVVMPELTKLGDIYYPTVEIGGFFLFFGLFLATFFTFAKKVPMVPLADPLLPAGMKMGHH